MAYNSFNGKTLDGVYLYGLTDNGIVFYIGVTGFIQSRYTQHMVDYSICGQYIKGMRQRGYYPGVIIYGVFKKFDIAEAAEHALIRILSLQGNKLCNKHQNPHDNYIYDHPLGDLNTKPARVKQKTYSKIIDEAIKDYNKFRLWQPKKISSQ